MLTLNFFQKKYGRSKMFRNFVCYITFQPAHAHFVNLFWKVNEESKNSNK